MSDSLAKVFFDRVENVDTDSFRQKREVKMNPQEFMNDLLMVHLLTKRNSVVFLVKVF